MKTMKTTIAPFTMIKVYPFLRFGRLTVLASSSVLLLAGQAIAVPVDFSNGFTVSQENFTFDGAGQAYSSYGLAAVNISTMTTDTGISGGYLNVFDPSQNSWVVQNLPVSSGSGLPGITTMFNLGNTPGNQVSSINLQADFSSTPTTSFFGTGINSLYSVTQLDYNAQGGKGAAVTGPPGAPPNPSLVNLLGAGLNSATWQAGHTSVEQDKNQCGPASVANSLDWLRSSQGLPLNAGLKNISGTAPGGTPTPANSLVAQIDKTMNRAPGATVADAQFLNGKLSFIDNPANGVKGNPDPRLILGCS